MNAPADKPAYRIGLPAWAFPGWRDRYFLNRPSVLASYASVFNTVEGNTTFYHIPTETSVSNWRRDLAGSDLEISFKLPRSITHESIPSRNDITVFFNRIEPLEQHIGPVLLQFPATIGPSHLGLLDKLFAQLPEAHRYVLEVRHPEFFREPQSLEPLLEKYRYGRVMMDTRAIFQGNKEHPEVTSAVHDKPDVPVMSRVYNRLLLVRLLLHPDRTSNDIYINQWVNRVSQGLAEGWDCYVMIHCPNNQHCPELAVQFHEALRAKVGLSNLEPLAPWPVPQQTRLI